jgi:hypothetical protein
VAAAAAEADLYEDAPAEETVEPEPVAAEDEPAADTGGEGDAAVEDAAEQDAAEQDNHAPASATNGADADAPADDPA